MSVRAALSATTAACAVASLLCLPAHAQDRIAVRQDRAAQLRAAVASETTRIQSTERGLAQAQQRLDLIEGQLTARRAQLERVARDLVATRDRLLRLENRMRQASGALAANLVHDYETPKPDLVSVVSQANSFSDLLELRDFLARIARRDAEILDNARSTRVDVGTEAERLVVLQARNRKLAAEIARRRDRADAVKTAVLGIRARQLARRNGKAAQLHAIEGQISAIRARQAREAKRAARIQRSAAAGQIAVNTSGAAQPPAGAPDAVAKVMAAGNAIATLPYLYGGGHGSFQASAYDCSGSVSYALAAAGLVSSPLDSTAFESWGQAGPGRWITVYANAGHAFMVVAGWRFDTSALSGGGTRWTQQMRPTGGFVARHPPGL
jgi:cell wall-associated NlpC family hydrolase